MGRDLHASKLTPDTPYSFKWIRIVDTRPTHTHTHHLFVVFMCWLIITPSQCLRERRDLTGGALKVLVVRHPFDELEPFENTN